MHICMLLQKKLRHDIPTHTPFPVPITRKTDSARIQDVSKYIMHDIVWNTPSFLKLFKPYFGNEYSTWLTKKKKMFE